MPWGDGTGPNGAGPMTGRGLGYCAGYNSPGYTKGIPAGGRGFGRGGGFGRGFRWRTRTVPLVSPIQPAVITEKEEKQYLEQELDALKGEMKEIEKRLKDLNKPKK